MNVDELLSADRELTDEEFEFLEQELLKTLREFNQQVQGICEGIEEKDPELAARLRRSAESALSDAEQAAAIPLRTPHGDDEVDAGGAAQPYLIAPRRTRDC
jgi:hypothetical protein